MENQEETLKPKRRGKEGKIKMSIKSDRKCKDRRENDLWIEKLHKQHIQFKIFFSFRSKLYCLL